MSGIWISFYDTSLEMVLEGYNEWFIGNTDDVTLAIYDDIDLEEQLEEWLDKNDIRFEWESGKPHPCHDYTMGRFTITRQQFKDKEMSTIEQLKQQAINQLEALQKVGADLDALKVKLSDVSLETLIEAYIKTEVTKIDNYAKRQKIDFKVDTSELVKLIKLPNSDKKPAQLLPFLPREGATLEDQSWTEWKVVDGEWTDQWYNSWESSSANC